VSTLSIPNKGIIREDTEFSQAAVAPFASEASSAVARRFHRIVLAHESVGKSPTLNHRSTMPQETLTSPTSHMWVMLSSLARVDTSTHCDHSLAGALHGNHPRWNRCSPSYGDQLNPQAEAAVQDPTWQ
jgi:hypothetical protein